MPDKKPTDNEIIKALDICSKSTNGCSHSKYTCEDCYLNGQPMCSAVLLQDAIDCFNRLQAENENYSKNNQQMTSDILKLYKELEQAKAENERLKEERDKEHDFCNHYMRMCVTAKAEAYKECIEKVGEIITEIYNKHVFGSNDLTDEEKDAIINFSDDITCKLRKLKEEMKGENDEPSSM